MTLLPGSVMFTKDEFPNTPMTFKYPAPPYMMPELGNPIWSDFGGKHKPCISKEQKVCFSWLRLGLVLMGGEHQEALSVKRAQMRSGERESVHSLPALDPRAPMPVSKHNQ